MSWVMALAGILAIVVLLTDAVDVRWPISQAFKGIGPKERKPDNRLYLKYMQMTGLEFTAWQRCPKCGTYDVHWIEPAVRAVEKNGKTTVVQCLRRTCRNEKCEFVWRNYHNEQSQ